MTKNPEDREAEQPPRIDLRHLLTYLLIFVVTPSLTFIIGKWLDRTLAFPQFPPFPLNLCVGLSIFFFGLALGIKSTRLLYKVGQGLPWGELDDQVKSTRLVTTGPYAYCRNPMTLGYSLLPLGMGIMFQSLGMTIPIPAVIFISLIIWLKAREEPNLERRFGEVYSQYKRSTPFLIPRPKPLILDLANAFSEFREGGPFKRKALSPRDFPESKKRREDLKE
jgi:protein-S-isoprenylcysteine O-methyltransferase Ste14